jgi:NADH-quinone oxidoreductase subunit J
MNLVDYTEIPEISAVENTKLLGSVLYTKYFFLFQISGLILLVAMIGSITLTLRKRGKSKKQNVSFQNNINSKESIIKKKINFGDGI